MEPTIGGHTLRLLRKLGEPSNRLEGSSMSIEISATHSREMRHASQGFHRQITTCKQDPDPRLQSNLPTHQQSIKPHLQLKRDRAGAQIELIGRGAYAAQTRNRFEGGKKMQEREPLGHGMISR